jgi:hypothetical protein
VAHGFDGAGEFFFGGEFGGGDAGGVGADDAAFLFLGLETGLLHGRLGIWVRVRHG